MNLSGSSELLSNKAGFSQIELSAEAVCDLILCMLNPSTKICIPFNTVTFGP
jgi:hypothetical protein